MELGTYMQNNRKEVLVETRFDINDAMFKCNCFIDGKASRTLQRHSRHTLSKDIAPLAKGTALVDIFLLKTFGAAGANAEVCATRDAMRTRGDVFMVGDNVQCLKICGSGFPTSLHCLPARFTFDVPKMIMTHILLLDT